MKVFVSIALLLGAFWSSAQTFTDLDTVIQHTSQGVEYTLKINKFPCDYDSSKTCISFDTLSKYVLAPKTVFQWADSIASSIGVPPKLVYEIGMNESHWPKPNDQKHLIKDGDLQIIDRTFDFMYKRLGLSGGRTRYNYLVVGIHYLKDCYNQGNGTWRQARYIYGRGRWKDPSQWTKLERHFMTKIDWKQYDK
ncbi:MAG: lytic transglycosylase domain-containing protein [Bacteroidia bacterium]|nr:lytic transglycosylase domain-containing protein [Bacteroidia bacterium]NNJ56481.1 hypothetical protein [Bacteroidia bacterium]